MMPRLSAKTALTTGVLGVATLTILLLVFRGTDKNETKPSLGSEPTHVHAATTAIVPAPNEERAPQEQPATSLQAEKASVSAPDGELVAAKADLAEFATESLYGTLQLNAVLEHMLTIASLPVKDHPDFGFEDDAQVAYEITGLPEGMNGHLLIGMHPFDADGTEYRYLSMDVRIPTEAPEYLDGAMRDGPNISLSISYDPAEPNKPTRVAVMLQRRANLSGSLARGIDAYTGQYTQGAVYGADLVDTTKGPSTTTFGIVNGNPASPPSFTGISPLSGDVSLDHELLGKVLEQLQKNLSTVKGQ